MSFIIGSGFTYRGGADKAKEFFQTWLNCIHRYAKPQPERIIVVCVGGAVPDFISDDVDVIQLNGNLMHGHHLLGIEKPQVPYAYSGWSAAFLATALLAYNNCTDFLWQESDCLGFGSYVEQAYKDLSDGGCVCGGPMRTPPYMPSATALILVKHDFIPEMVRHYLSIGDERSPKRMVEHKMAFLKTVSPKFRSLSFGVDRERPLPVKSPCWYAQQITDSELAELRKRGLI